MEKGVTQEFLRNKAAETITLAKQINTLSETLEENKDFFRLQANGDTLSLDVEGVGSLLVKKPVEGTSKQVMSFDESKFQYLSQEIKDALIATGTVSIKTVEGRTSKAAVVVSPNK